MSQEVLRRVLSGGRVPLRRYYYRDPGRGNNIALKDRRTSEPNGDRRFAFFFTVYILCGYCIYQFTIVYIRERRI